MDRKQLLAFERIVREGSFSRAARSLALSQAAISARIQALETAVGEPLLLRGGRQVTLTAAGEAFLPYARRTLTVLAEGVAAAHEARTGHGGRVVIHAPTSVVDGFLTQAVSRYRVTHPQVALAVHVGHTDQIITALADGVALLGIVTSSYVTGAPPLLPLLRLREPLLAVVGAGHRLAGATGLALADFVAQAAPFYQIAWGTSDDIVLAQLVASQGNATTLPFAMVRQLVELGQGGVLVPRTCALPDLASGRLVAVPLAAGAAPQRDLAVVQQTDGPVLPPAACDFVATIRAVAHALVVR